MAQIYPVLNRNGVVPLYAQIRDALRQQIDSHSLPTGALLPTEEELQNGYGVSRSVVRQALSELSDVGLITRQRGRGSVVAPASEPRRRVSQAGGLRQQFAEAGQELRTRLLSVTEETAPGAATDELGTSLTWRLERLRLADGQPVVYMQTWIPRTVFPHVTADQLDGRSLHDWMRSRGVEPEGGMRHMQAVPADARVAEMLETAPGTPVLLLEGITRDENGLGVEWFSAWHRPHTVFDIDARVMEPTPKEGVLPSERLEHARGLLASLSAALN